MVKKESEQAPLTNDDDSWERTVQQAKELPERYPKLRFGDDKLAEVVMSVMIEENKPRVIKFNDEFNGGREARAWAINVRVIGGSEDGAMRALIFPSNEEHGLTRGVLSVAKKHPGALKGVCLRIETKNYANKRFKTKTRGYTVSEIAPPSASSP